MLNMKNKSENTHVIASVEEDSPAFRAGLRAGDILLSANGKDLKDIFDYYYQTDDEQVELVFLRGGK